MSQSKDYEWYCKNYKELQKFGDCFVSIKDKTILGIFESFEEAVKETAKKEELGTFIVQEVQKIGEVPCAYLYHYSVVSEMEKMGASDKEIQFLKSETVVNAIANRRTPEDVAWAVLQ